MILFHVVDFSNSELLPRTTSLGKENLLCIINNVCIKILSSSPENYFILLAFFVSPKKKKNEILYSYSNYLSLQNFFAIAHFQIDHASFNFTPWKGIDKNSASIDFLQEKKKKKRKQVKVSKNPLSLG